MKYKKLSLVIPVYNEETTIEELLNLVIQTDLGIEKEILCIDDGSNDDTRKILSKYQKKNKIKFLKNNKNLGKTQTVRKGLLETTGDLVVIQDADLEYEPQDLKRFIDLFNNSNVDVVYGNRFGQKNKVIFRSLWLGNTFLSIVSSLFTYPRARIYTRDMEVCYKMMKGNIFRNIAKNIKAKSRFGLEPELTARIAKYKINGKHINFKQIPINYHPREFSEGKHMEPIKDGLKALWEIVKFNTFIN